MIFKANSIFKSIAIFTFLISFQIVVNGQNLVTPEWAKSEIGATNNLAEAWGVDVDDQGNVYWAFNADNHNQGLDLICYKYDANGNEIWSTPFFYGGLGTQQSYIVNASDTFLYIGGRECTGFTNTCDMLLLKIDKSDGSLIWKKTLNFSGNGYDELDGLVLMDDGIYCGGWAHELESGSFNADMGFWKLDYSGNTIWTNYFGKSGSAEHQDGHFVVDENFIYAAGLWDGGGAFNLYNGYAFVGKFDKSDGSFVDSSLFGQQSNNFLDIENALGMTSAGDYLYITGYATPVAANNWQLFVAKYDKNLNQIWYMDWGGEDTESARGITVVDDVIYVAGLTSSPSLMSGGGGRDALILQLDTNGNVLTYETWGDSLKNSFRDIYADDDVVYLSGTTELDTTSGKKSAFMVKVATQTIGTKKFSNDQRFDFNIFPNPSNGVISVNFSGNLNEKQQLIITDINGKEVSRLMLEPGQKEVEINLKSKGIYLATYLTNNFRMSRKIVVQ